MGRAGQGRAGVSRSSPLRAWGNCSRAGPLGDWEARADTLEAPPHTVAASPLFFLPRRPLRCQWRPGAAQENTRSTCSPCGPWGSGTAWRWRSPTTASAAAVQGWSPTAPGAAGTAPTSVACVSATPATWAPGASARKGRTRAGTRTCAGRRTASPCAAAVGSATATSAPASRVSSERSTGLSASATTSPVLGTRESSAQVGAPGRPICPEPGPGQLPSGHPPEHAFHFLPPSWEEMRASLVHPPGLGWGQHVTYKS